ncbi:MAG: hypothetical protein DSY38_03875, partial [Fusobacteria bacterium]
MKKRILLGLLAVSAITMAATPQAGTFSNRFGINYGTSASEKWDKEDATPFDIHDDSYGLNYKLLYNVTDKFRWGGEVGYDNVNYSGDAKKYKFNDGDSAGVFLLGLALEYDLYHAQSMAFYLNGSLGVAANELKIYKGVSQSGNIDSATLNAG